jgi:hypothetical protein
VSARLGDGGPFGDSTELVQVGLNDRKVHDFGSEAVVSASIVIDDKRLEKTTSSGRRQRFTNWFSFRAPRSGIITVLVTPQDGVQPDIEILRGRRLVAHSRDRADLLGNTVQFEAAEQERFTIRISGKGTAQALTAPLGAYDLAIAGLLDEFR